MNFSEITAGFENDSDLKEIGWCGGVKLFFPFKPFRSA
jgi:hypothetical protein